MSDKYFEFTGETKVWCGITLRQIRATRDLKNGVKKGAVGGWIERESQVYGNAWVYGNAQVYGNARVSGNAQACCDARIESTSAILMIAIGGFYTVTLTRKWLFAGCQSIARKDIKKITQAKFVEMGGRKELYKPLKAMVLAGLTVVKEKP